jgi:hypothetical protein
MGPLRALEAISMRVCVGIVRCFVGVCGIVALGSAGCASTLPNDDTTRELERLRAAVRQSDERVVAIQAQQVELTQQVTVLSAFVAAMANEAAARRDEAARKKPSLPAGNAAASALKPAEPPKPPDSPDLEF